MMKMKLAQKLAVFLFLIPEVFGVTSEYIYRHKKHVKNLYSTFNLQNLFSVNVLEEFPTGLYNGRIGSLMGEKWFILSKEFQSTFSLSMRIEQLPDQNAITVLVTIGGLSVELDTNGSQNAQKLTIGLPGLAMPFEIEVPLSTEVLKIALSLSNRILEMHANCLLMETVPLPHNLSELLTNKHHKVNTSHMVTCHCLSQQYLLMNVTFRFSILLYQVIHMLP